MEDTDTRYGVEVDIRTRGPELIIHHNPFVEGESFEEWIKSYRHRLLILNTKEEGLEKRLLSIMSDNDINDFFFLDQSMPFLVKTAKAGESRCAVRVSEFEPTAMAMTLAGLVQWVWVDCFTRFPLDGSAAKQLMEAGFKLCLVSPELQGRNDQVEIEEIQGILKDRKIAVHAVCTKEPVLWAE